MKRLAVGTALMVVGLAIGASAAQAQVWAVPKGVGVTVAGDFNLSLADGSPNWIDGRIALGLPMVGFQATFTPNALDAVENNIGVDAAVQLIPMPVSVRVQAGARYGTDSKTFMVPAGVVIGLNVPSPMLSVDPFIFPQVRYTHFDGGGSNTDFGVTAGLNIGLPSGLGGHIAVDYDNALKKVVDFKSAVTVAVGVHYRISVPSLGMM